MVLAALVLVSSAGAATNSLRIAPSVVSGDPGGSVEVSLVASPPAGTLTAWVLDVRFDPEVATTEPVLCDPVDTPSGALGVVACDVVDVDGDRARETVKAFGTVVYRSDGNGFARDVRLADITFRIEGEPGDCTNLRIGVVSFLDAEANETSPAVTNGRVCVTGEGVTAPPTPPGETGAPPDVDDGTPGPTVTGGATGGTDGTPANGDGATAPPGETDGATNGTGPADGTDGTGSPVSPRTGTDGADNGDGGDDDEDGGSSLVWPVVGVIAGLLVIGGGAFAVQRLRTRAGGGAPPSEPPPGAG